MQPFAPLGVLAVVVPVVALAGQSPSLNTFSPVAKSHSLFTTGVLVQMVKSPGAVLKTLME